MKLNYGMVSVAALALGLGACTKTTPIETSKDNLENSSDEDNTQDL